MGQRLTVNSFTFCNNCSTSKDRYRSQRHSADGTFAVTIASNQIGDKNTTPVRHVQCLYLPTPILRRSVIIGHQFVNPDRNKLSPTKAVNTTSIGRRGAQAPGRIK